jgi:peptidoglycan hydrolase-like protein with peptidoglycan-binding domain/DNA invertase Pin-like site-specific DNA recombinase
MRSKQCVGVTRVLAASIMASLALLCVPTLTSAAEPGASPRVAADGALSAGAGYGQPQGDSRVRALQRRLRALGHRPGPVDGLYGPRTEAAVERLQRDGGIAVDGVVGPQTRRLLNREAPRLAPGAGYGQPGGSPQVRDIQRQLRAAGSRPGPIDGVYGPRTEAAVERFQRSAGEPVSGVLSPATAAALARAGSDQQTRSNDTGGSDEPRRRGGSPETEPPAAGLDTSPTRRAPVADNRIDESDGAGSTFPVPLVVLAFALAATGGLLAVWLRRRRPRPESGQAAAGPVIPLPMPNGEGKAATGANGSRAASTPEPRPEQVAVVAAAAPVEPAPMPKGNGNGAKPSNGSRAATDEPTRRRDGAVALGYVSAREPEATDGPELRDQMAAIDAACRQRGLVLSDVVQDLEQVENPGPERPGMQHALERLAAREASCLVVADLGRLSRSAPEVGQIVGLLREREARLVAVGDGLDTSTKRGGQAADELVSVGVAARQRRTSARNRRLEPGPVQRPAGSARRGNRPSRNGVSALKERMRAMRASGMSLQAIADQLNAEKVPPLNGGTKWRPSAVQQATGGARAAGGSSGRRGTSPRPTSNRNGGGEP